MTDVNAAAAARDTLDDILEPALETRSATPRRPAVPARRAALPKPAVRASEDVRQLTRAIEAQNVQLARLSPSERRAAPQSSPSAVARKKLHDIRMRLNQAHNDAVDKRDADRSRRRHDPLNDATIARTEQALSHAERRELAELRSARLRPSGPSPSTRAAAPARSQAFQMHRRATLEYLRTGQEIFGGRHLREIQRSAFEARALNTQLGADGGYLVHPEQSTGPIEKLLQELSPMRQLAEVRNISAASYVEPFDIGGVAAEWVGEEQSRPETATPSLVEIETVAMELYAKPKASQTMLEDSSFDVEGWLAERVADAFALKETVAFYAGDGVKKPRGILAYDNVANASWSWGKVGYIATGADGAFPTPTSTLNGYDKLMDLVYALPATIRQASSFQFNRTTISKVRQLKDPQGQFIFSPMGKDGEPASLIGYTVHEAEQMPDIGSGTFSIAFGDWQRAYRIVDRVGLTVLRDPYSAKPYVEFYTRKRVGGGIKNFEALKLLKFSAS